MTEALSSTIDYKVYDAKLSRYRYRQIPLNNVSSATLTYQPNSVSNNQFQIPADIVFNLARSYISYQVTIPAGGSGTYPYCFSNNQDFCSYIDFSDGSKKVIEIYNADRFTSMMQPIRTTMDEFTTNDPLTTLYPIGSGYQTSLYEGGSNIGEGTNTGATMLPCGADGLLNADAAIVLSQAGVANDIQYISLLYEASTAHSGSYSRMLPLRVFKDTIYAMDKDIAFKNMMYINFQTAYGNRMGFYSTVAAGNTSGYQIYGTSSDAGTISNITSNVTVNNVYLYLACETNQTIQDSILGSINSGVKMLVPWVQCVKQPITGVGGGSITTTITDAYGHKLKKVVGAPFNSVEQGNYAFDHQNLNGTKITTIYTTWDSKRLQDYPLNCWNPNSLAVTPSNNGFSSTTFPFSDDYREMKPFLEGTCLQNYMMYSHNWFYQDVFGEQGTLSEMICNINDSNINEGVNLKDSPHTYGVTIQTPCINNSNAATANSINYYLYFFYTRYMTISPAGINFE